MEDMDHQVTIVHQDPLAAIKAFNRRRLLAQLGELDADFIADGLSLAGIVAGNYEEMIGKTRNFAQVQDLGVVALFGLSRPYGSHNGGRHNYSSVYCSNSYRGDGYEIVVQICSVVLIKLQLLSGRILH
jgi:hypothetical protein